MVICSLIDWNEFCGSDVEERKMHKVSSTSQHSGKRLSETTELAPVAKRQALESSTGSPKSSSPKRIVALSRESSMKSLDKGKVKPDNQMPIRNHTGGDNMEITRSPSTGPHGLLRKGMDLSTLFCAFFFFFLILGIIFNHLSNEGSSTLLRFY